MAGRLLMNMNVSSKSPPLSSMCWKRKGGTYLTVGSHTKLPFVEQALVKIQDWLDKSPEEYEYNYQNGMIGAPTVGEARELIDEMLASVRLVMLNYSKEAWDYIYVFITH